MIKYKRNSKSKSIHSIYKIAKAARSELAEKATEYYVNKGINKLNKKFTSSKGSGITLTNNEIKDIVKIIRFLGNRGILIKGTTRKITSQEGEFLNFLDH